MRVVLNVVFFSLLFLSVESGYCPPNSADYTDGEECITCIDADAIFQNAQKACTGIGGRLVQPRNAFENTFVNQQNVQNLHAGSTWIGVARTNGIWRYADGSQLTYANWKSVNEPNITGNDCAMLNGTTAQWISGNCATKRPFICTFSDRDYSCPNGWTRYENYCYYTPSASNWGPQPPNITFASGEALCVQNQAHLVSIHSEAENNFVNGLYADAIGNYTSGCSIRLEGVIGLSGRTWTDALPTRL
ncbi:unnamed protein product, partial [Mesorhabditis spiculigera]